MREGHTQTVKHRDRDTSTNQEKVGEQGALTDCQVQSVVYVSTPRGSKAHSLANKPTGRDKSEH